MRWLWPDGKDGPLNPVNRSMSGRARSTIHLTKSATPNWPPTVRARNAAVAASPWRRAGHDADDHRHRYQHHRPSELGDVPQDLSRRRVAWRAAKRAALEVEVGETQVVSHHEENQPEGGGADHDHGRGGGQSQSGEGRRIESSGAWPPRQAGMAVHFFTDADRFDPRGRAGGRPVAGTPARRAARRRPSPPG